MGEPPRASDSVPSSLGLALLESLRDADTPAGVMPSEKDLPLALRRRLGLSRVVDDQIRRYARLRPRDGVTAQEATQLFELIGRRPDASSVLAVAGRRLAAAHLPKRARRIRRRALPAGLRQRLALRRVRRIARELNPGAEIAVHTKPPSLEIARCLPARAVGNGTGCALLAGLIEAVLEGYGVDGLRPLHAACEGRSDARCVWRFEPRD